MAALVCVGLVGMSACGGAGGGEGSLGPGRPYGGESTAGEGSGQGAGQGAGRGAGKASGAGPGSGSRSGSGSGEGPGSGSGQGAGKGSGKGSGKGPGSGPGSGNASGGPGAGADDPHSPFVVAAALVGARSRDSVLTLHALGVGTTRPVGSGASLVPGEGRRLRREFRDQVVETTRLVPPRGSAAAKLTSALEAYGRAAAGLARWQPDTGPLPKSWFRRLEAADETWLQALGELSELSGHDLLQDLPTLPMPNES